MRQSLLYFYFFVLLLFNPQARAQESPAVLLNKLSQAGRDTARAELYIELSRYHIMKTGARNTDMDSARSYLRLALELSRQLAYTKGEGRAYVGYSWTYREQEQLEKGREYIEKAIALFDQHRLYDELADAYLERSNYFPAVADKMDEKLAFAGKALAAFTQSGNKMRQADTYKYLGDLYYIENDLDKSLDALTRALALYKTCGWKELQGVYDLLGIVYTSKGDNKNGLGYGLLALKTAEELRDSSAQIATIYNRIGLTYHSTSKFDEASKFFGRAYAIFQRSKDTSNIILLANNMSYDMIILRRFDEAERVLLEIEKKYRIDDTGYHLFLLSNLMDIYSMTGKKPQAARTLGKIEALVRGKQLATTDRFRYHLASLRFYFLNQQYPEMRKHMLEVDKIANEANSIWLLRVAQMNWYRLDSAEGNYLSALRHYQQFKEMSDSIFNETKTRQITQMQVEYETEKKDQEIGMQEQNIRLLTKEKQLQQSSLRQERLVRNITFGGVALLLVIVGLLYNRYRLKQKTNQQLEIQQEEINRKNSSLQQLVTEKEWLLKEIHHRVKNNLQIVMSLLNTQSAYLENDSALQAIRDSQNRVNAISLIHQKLYQSDNVAAIDMLVYVSDLVEHLIESAGIRRKILFNLNIEPVKLDVAQAVPLGLILNEAITNCIKYAFPKEAEGHIQISLQYLGDRELALVIADDGIGLPSDFDPESSNSLGMNLMKGLSEDIEGSFSISGENGTTIRINFPYDDPEFISHEQPALVTKTI